jgi:UDP:flavonoid glycosyltransferase YjiC (YdhE family)
MISFVTFGSWGDVSPLLEIALQFRDEGISSQFITGPEWVERIEGYGIECHGVGKVARSHADNVNAFLATRLLGQIGTLADEVTEAAKGSAVIVGAVFAWPAQIAAKRLGIVYRATTTSPCYFLDTEPSFQFERCIAEAQAIEPLGHTTAISLSPWFFAAANLPSPGFPRLRQGTLSKEVAEFIEQPHAVITAGTFVRMRELNDLIDKVHEIGLKVLFLGTQECTADLCSPFEPLEAAVAKSAFVVTHAGLGTSVECLAKPMVVRPVAYDQFYNADRLVELGAAVFDLADVGKAVPSLSNNWSLRAFARLL